MGEFDVDLALFSSEFLPNAQGTSDGFDGFKRSKLDYQKWLVFRDALLRGENPEPPTMGTRYGRLLVAAAKQHMSISHLVGQVTNPYPPPDPTPPPSDPPLPPQFTTNITDGQVVSVPYTWTASTVPTATSIEFYADNSQLEVDSSDPFSHTLNLSAGAHELGLAATVNGTRHVMPPAPGANGFARITVPTGGTLPPRSTNVVRRLTRVNSTSFNAARNKYQPAGSYWSPPELTNGTPWPGGVVGQTDITTPHGQGVKVICSDAMRAPWAPTTARISDLEWNPNTSLFTGQAQQWDGYILLPSTGNPSGVGGGFFDGHNILQIGDTTGGTFGSTNGHKLFLTSDRRFRFAIRAVDEQFASTWFTSPVVAFDVWHHIRWETLVTTASNGYHRGWVNGELIMQHTGPTIFSGESVWQVMMGWYSPVGLDNELWFSEWQLGLQ